MLIVPVGENNYRNFKRYSLIRLRVVFQNVVVNVNVVRLASFFFFSLRDWPHVFSAHF